MPHSSGVWLVNSLRTNPCESADTWFVWFLRSIGIARQVPSAVSGNAVVEDVGVVLRCEDDACCV